MAKYLLTGCAGLIGAQTARTLLTQGHEVIGLDNLNDYYDPDLKRHRLESLVLQKKFQFVELDIENKKTLQSLVSLHSFDGIINLAARAGVRASMDFPDIYFTTNVNGTLNLLEMAKNYKIKKFVLASTSSLYAGLPVPFKEDLAVNTPISPYAASKKAAEMLTYTYHHLYGIDVSVVRYFTVYGPAGRPDMSPFIFANSILNEKKFSIFGDGGQSRDFTYVDDIAEGTVLALKPVGYEVINLGGGNNPHSLNQMIQLMEDELGKKAICEFGKMHKADMETTWADISKAQKILGWKPKVSFEEGMRRTVDWHIQQNSWLTKKF